MTITPEELANIKQAAEAATPGPWWTGKPYTHVFADGYDCAERVDFVCESPNDTKDPVADINFIALCNPANVLSLVAAVEALQMQCLDHESAIVLLEKEVEAGAADTRRLDALTEQGLRTVYFEKRHGLPVTAMELFVPKQISCQGFSNPRDLADAILAAKEGQA